jgi:asparagine synthase (glutamine-hydrolysing)
MRGILPDPVIDRPKRGFAVPLNHWFRGTLRHQVRDLLLGERTRRRGIFNTTYLETLVSLNEQGRNLDLQIWTLISFELWARIFVDGDRKAFARSARGGERPLMVERSPASLTRVS